MKMADIKGRLDELVRGGWVFEEVETELQVDVDGYTEDAEGKRWKHWQAGNTLRVTLTAYRAETLQTKVEAGEQRGG